MSTEQREARRDRPPPPISGRWALGLLVGSIVVWVLAMGWTANRGTGWDRLVQRYPDTGQPRANPQGRTAVHLVGSDGASRGFGGNPVTEPLWASRKSPLEVGFGDEGFWVAPKVRAWYNFWAPARGIFVPWVEVVDCGAREHWRPMTLRGTAVRLRVDNDALLEACQIWHREQGDG